MQKYLFGASLVVQWIRICPQGRGYRFDPCSGKIPHAMGATKAAITEATGCNY